MRRIQHIEDLERSDNIHPGGIHRHEDLRLLEMLGGLGVRFDHADHDLATGIAGARRPVLLAVNHPLVALEGGRGADVGRIRGSDSRLGHAKAGADLACEQGLQPLLFLCLTAVFMQYFHVAGIRRGAVEDLGSQARLAHLLGQVGVLDGVET